MNRLLLGVSSLLILGACADTQGVADALARQSAKTTVSTALSTRFPNVPAALVTPFTDCIIDNASSSEIITLAASAVAGLNEEAVEITGQVLSRPQTQTCVANASVGALVNL